MKISSIVVLTGAGISAESGIRTFRDSQGLWEQHKIEDVASIEGFQKNPELVHHFYNLRRQQLLSSEVHPNAAHLALARLEKEFPGYFLLVTQNVDDLHERAGSKNMIHMHGELLKARCVFSDEISEIRRDLSPDSICPCCGKKNSLRPHIVWFGEVPLEMHRIYSALEKCDLFISIGTSGNVYPAAGFVEAVNPNTKTIEVNLERSLVANSFQEHRIGNATRLVPALVEEIMASHCPHRVNQTP